MNKYRGIWHGKRLDNGEWVEGYLRKQNLNGIIRYSILTESGGNCLVDPETLGECSCIPDMNGKPIFEGDVCTVLSPNIGDDEYGLVRYDESEAVFIIDFGTFTINFCNNINGSAVEVVGSIHDGYKPTI